MKLFRKSIIVLSLSMTVFSSCSDLLDAPTQSSLDESFIFANKVLADQAVMGIHQSLCETNSYRGRFIPYYGLNTDIEWYNSSENLTDDRALLTSYAAVADGTTMNLSNGPWSKMYEGIERANLCIRGLRAFGQVSTKEEMAQLLGEALTLRAMIYFDLIKAYGDVVARFEPITTQTLYLPKSDRDVVYKQIIADLGEAESLTGWPNATTMTQSVERVNKAFVKGLRARVCLSAAGYSQRADGTIRRSTDPELSVDKLYPIVKQECLDVIESSTASLGATYVENFKNLCLEKTTAGGESLFEIPFASGRGRVMYTFGVKHTTTDKYTQQAAGGANGPLPTVFYDFDKRDLRRDITCVPYEWTGGVQVPRKISSWCFGKLRYEWMTRVVTSTNDDGINWQVMRMADVYLMAAEAINELEGPANAAPYLKVIRERAFANNKDLADAYVASVSTDKETFFQAIVNERALEFCGEMLRRQDLIRWNLLSSKINEAKTKLTALAYRTGVYADLPEKIYYKTAADGESVVIYGLEHGDTDDAGKALGYTEKGWFISNGLNNLTDLKVGSLFQLDPDSRQFWPIPQVVISASNNSLVNDSWFSSTSN